MSATEVVLRGVPMHLFEYEAVSEAIRQAGDFYEADILDDLRARRPSEVVIVDAGANIGNHSAYWAAFVPHRTILAFEPEPDNFALLSLNLDREPSAVCYPLALSDHRGHIHMEIDQVNRGRCRVSDAGELEVDATTLDTLALDDVSFIKVDVEGHQAMVLSGAIRTIERCHPAIMVEDEDDSAAAVLRSVIGYRHVAEWHGANHLWEWRP